MHNVTGDDHDDFGYLPQPESSVTLFVCHAEVSIGALPESFSVSILDTRVWHHGRGVCCAQACVGGAATLWPLPPRFSER